MVCTTSSFFWIPSPASHALLGPSSNCHLLSSAGVNAFRAIATKQDLGNVCGARPGSLPQPWSLTKLNKNGYDGCDLCLSFSLHNDCFLFFVCKAADPGCHGTTRGFTITLTMNVKVVSVQLCSTSCALALYALRHHGFEFRRRTASSCKFYMG